MVGWSTLIAVVGGLPLGLLLVLTDRGGLLRNVVANKVIGQVQSVIGDAAHMEPDRV